MRCLVSAIIRNQRRTGIADASEACNVQLTRDKKRDYELIREARNIGKRRAREVLENLDEDALNILEELSGSPGKH